MAERIEEYHAIGFDEFILSGHPHLEEAYWFAEGVKPVLRQRGLLADTGGAAERVSLPKDIYGAVLAANVSAR